jgi:hypothetical protein
VFLDENLCLLPVSRFGNNVDVLRAFEQLADPRADDVVVIRQKDADFGF